MSTSKLQRYVSKLLSNELAGLTIKENVRPDWLITKDGSRLELDFYVEEIQAAIEVQGKQHYEYIPHFHGDYQRFQAQLEWDSFKREICQKRGVALFEVGDELEAKEAIAKMRAMVLPPEPPKTPFTSQPQRVLRNEDQHSRGGVPAYYQVNCPECGFVWGSALKGRTVEVNCSNCKVVSAVVVRVILTQSTVREELGHYRR